MVEPVTVASIMQGAAKLGSAKANTADITRQTVLADTGAAANNIATQEASEYAAAEKLRPQGHDDFRSKRLKAPPKPKGKRQVSSAKTQRDSLEVDSGQSLPHADEHYQGSQGGRVPEHPWANASPSWTKVDSAWKTASSPGKLTRAIDRFRQSQPEADFNSNPYQQINSNQKQNFATIA